MNNWTYVIWALIILVNVSLALVVIVKAKGEYLEDSLIKSIGIFCTCVFGISLLFVTIGHSISRHNAQTKYYIYQEKYEYVMDVISRMDDYDLANLGITETILNYNSWLESAKADKKVYGNWSDYFDLPVEEMEYIGANGR